MTKATFELGGNNPFIVLPDADIDAAVKAAYISRMISNGQAAVNGKRFIIHDRVYDEFKYKLINYIIKHTHIGDPMNPKTVQGPMGVGKTRIHLRKKVNMAVEQYGAEIAYGEVNYKMTEPGFENGFFQEPIVLENIPVESQMF